VTEILTESFCERCGTRYTFESAAPRRSRLGKVRTLSKGMKNFVLSDDASFSEAMAEARSEEEFTAVSHQLDAFHQTFNFCLTCRQYTCGDCWNAPESRCLTCAPIPGMDEPAFAAAANVPAFEDTLPAPYETNGIDPVEAWPDEDLSAARLSRALGLDEAEADATLEAVGQDEEFDLGAATAAAAAVTGAAAIVDSDDDRSAIAEEEKETAAELEPVVAEADALTAEDAGPAVLGMAPGQSLEDAVAEYEARVAAEETVEDVAPAPPTASTPDSVFVDDDLPLAAAAAAEAQVEADAEPAPVGEEEPAPVAEPLPQPQTIAAAIAAGAALAAVPGETPAARDEAPDVAEAPAERDLGLAAALAGLAAGAAVSDRDETHVADVEHEAPAAAVAPGPEPEPVAAEPEPEPVAAEPEPEPVAAEPARVDVVTQPTWPQPAPSPATEPVPAAADQPVTPAPAPWLTVAPEDSDGPQWPVAPAFPTPSVRRDMPTTLAGRPLVPQADPSGLWAASAREVLTGAAKAPVQAAVPTPTAQPCVSCGLSLSANARFCRRCGTRQA
jgi:nicotinate-nucleotide--dimethylbenzimidazole phosphoribosyltransferase